MCTTKQNNSHGNLPFFQKVPFVLIYLTAALLTAKFCAIEMNKSLYWFQFKSQLENGFLVFKFIVWLVIPVILSIKGFDKEYFTFKRWEKIDWFIPGFFLLLGIAAVSVIPHFKELRAFYPSLAESTPVMKLNYTFFFLTWTISWLPATEFLNRYYLLRASSAKWPRWGWLLVPISEGLNHLDKFILEAVVMVFFSSLLTLWTVKRKNLLLPFLVHLIIELELLYFMLFI